jgi:hypothetical protein
MSMTDDDLTTIQEKALDAHYLLRASDYDHSEAEDVLRKDVAALVAEVRRLRAVIASVKLSCGYDCREVLDKL